MIETESFSAHNQRLGEMTCRIIESLTPKRLSYSMSMTHRALQSLAMQATKLQLRKAEELYSPLSRVPNSNLIMLASHFQRELEAITSAMSDLLKRWPDIVSIQRNPTQFIQESLLVLETLEERIQRESILLLPLAKVA